MRNILKPSYLLILFCLTLFVSQTSYAGSKKKKKKSTEDKYHGLVGETQQHRILVADDLFRQQSFYNAIDEYKALHKLAPKNEYVLYQLGICYFYSRDYENTILYFTRLTTLNEKTRYSMAWFRLGEALKTQQRYDDAKIAFTKFRKSRSYTNEAKLYKRVVQNEEKGCDFAQDLIKRDTIDFIKIEHLEGGVNKAYTDFSPIPAGKDTLIFASLRKDSVIEFAYDEESFYPVKLYKSIKSADTSIWQDPVELTDYNNKYDHNANGSFSPNFDRFYFTRCKIDRNNTIYCNIYSSALKNGKWSKPKKANQKVNYHHYSSTQPTVGTLKKSVKIKDGKKKKKIEVTYDVLYFSSNRPGGKGGKDIWYTIVDSLGKYSEPVNCGSKINTKRDEITPFYDDSSETLFFSSNSHHGLGMMDVFHVSGNQKSWKKPVNMGLSINTSYDDTYYNFGKNREQGFLVSNRPGGIALKSPTCCDDIYSFEEYTPASYKISGLVYSKDDTSRVLLSGVDVGFIHKYDFEKNHILDSTNTAITWRTDTTVNGNYEVNYGRPRQYWAIFKKEGYYPIKVPLDSLIGDRDNNKEDIVIETDMRKIPGHPKWVVPIYKKLTLDLTDADLTANTKFVIEDLHYGFASDTVVKESKPSLDLLLNFMKKFKYVTVEIGGHTDSVGTNKDNLDLSRRRAIYVAKYLVVHGISKRRVRPKGYGEEQPIAPNSKPDGTDNPKGRALNRRTEIKILSLLPKDSKVTKRKTHLQKKKR